MAIDPLANWKIHQFEYDGLRGEEAVELLYHRWIERYEDPKTEREVFRSFFFADTFEEAAALYFHLHPEEAQNLLEAEEIKYSGWRRLARPICEYFENPMFSARKNAARRVVRDISDVIET